MKKILDNIDAGVKAGKAKAKQADLPDNLEGLIMAEQKRPTYGYTLTDYEHGFNNALLTVNKIIKDYRKEQE
ncbi:MAG: hypothetical protein PHI16_06080 [Methanocellales archaeon]|nr:hypothetical protein [Methanocellales archaeon]